MTDRCAICNFYPPWVPRLGNKEGKDGEIYDGVAIQTRLCAIHLSVVRTRTPQGEGGLVRGVLPSGGLPLFRTTLRVIVPP